MAHWGLVRPSAPLLLLLLSLVLATASPGGPDLRERALVESYGALATARSARTRKAFERIAREAPALLFDVELQRAYWYATLKRKRGAPVDLRVREGREDVLAAGHAAWLESAGLRGAFRYFFERSQMRQQIEPHIAEVRPYLDGLLAASRARHCLGYLRLAEGGRYLLRDEVRREGRGLPGVPIEVPRLQRLGLLPEDSGDCGEDPGDWELRGEAGFHSPLVGHSGQPRLGPGPDLEALEKLNPENPFLHALLRDLPPEPPTPGFDISLRDGLEALDGGRPEIAEKALISCELALRGVRGGEGLRRRVLLLLAEAHRARGLVEAARRALARARELPLEGVEGARVQLAEARLEREEGHWDQAMALLDKAGLRLGTLSGETRRLRLRMLRERALCAHLQGDLAVEVQSLEEARELDPEHVPTLLSLGRALLDHGREGEVPGVVEVVQRVLGGEAGVPEAWLRAASRLLTLEVERRGGAPAPRLQSLEEEVLGELSGAGEGLGLEHAPGSFTLLRLSELFRLRDRFARAEACLVQATLRARREGGEGSPWLARIAAERKLLEGARTRAEGAVRRCKEALGRIRSLLEGGKPRKALGEVEAARKLLPDPPRLRAPLLGWLRYYGLRAAHQAKDYEAAYDVLLSREATPFDLEAGNLAYMFSVGVELGARLSRPSVELVRWGRACVETREKDQDSAGAIACARTAGSMLELRDEEHRAAPFAEDLIRLGDEASDPALIMEGFELLAVGWYRSGRRRELSHMIPRMDGLLARLPLTPELIERRKQLLQVLTGKFQLESHEAELRRFLGEAP